MAGDEISSETGDNADTSATGKGNQQSRQQANPRQNMRGGDTYYGGDNSQQWIVVQILDHAQQLRELTLRLDDLPNKFLKLERRVDNQDDNQDEQDDRVKRLEDLEVVVRKEEVLIRPVAPPDATNLSVRTLLIFLVIAFVVVMAAVIYLVYLQAVSRA